MSPLLDYELLDFGDARKLERFGEYVVDRPCPTAEQITRHDVAAWQETSAWFDRANAQSGTWHIERPAATPWCCDLGPVALHLALTPAGQVGLFPEQADNWAWLMQKIRSLDSHTNDTTQSRPRVVNLFAYTGASTIAAARAGAEVVHVDSAKSSVQWARRNAELNHVSDHPIRWIVEDAPKFIRRELKRGNRYQGVILDPPSYGHGPKREAWDIRRDLFDLWHDCLALLEGPHTFILLSSHSAEYDRAGLQRLIAETEFDQHTNTQVSVNRPSAHTEIVDMHLVTSQGRRLPSGTALRWTQAASP